MHGKRDSHLRVSRDQFEQLVVRALDGLPEDFARLLDNIAVVVEDEPSDELLAEMGFDVDDPDRDELLGLYQGVPLNDRDMSYSQLPDRVTIYRGPILRSCSSRREVMREVRDTVVHELGHHFGLEDADMPY